jgi:hypothetical protein
MDLAEGRVAGVVQGVVEVEQPDAGARYGAGHAGPERDEGFDSHGCPFTLARGLLAKLRPMMRRRPFRAWCLWLVAMAFLCMQLTTAAYACPALQGTPDAAAMPGCEGMAGSPMDTDQPTLCKAHCDKDKQSAAADIPSPALPMPALLMHGLGWRLVDDERGVTLGRPALDTGPPRGTPPLFITYLVLRN